MVLGDQIPRGIPRRGGRRACACAGRGTRESLEQWNSGPQHARQEIVSLHADRSGRLASPAVPLQRSLPARRTACDARSAQDEQTPPRTPTSRPFRTSSESPRSAAGASASRRGCRISRGRWRNPQRARGRDADRLGCAPNQRRRRAHIRRPLENPTTNGRGRGLTRQPHAKATQRQPVAVRSSSKSRWFHSGATPSSWAAPVAR
jgi:hypothetical protein